jgi:uncharacterized protein (TIGR03067 family)
MRPRLFGVAVVAFLFTATAAIALADDAKDAAIQKDRNQIKGTWRVVTLIVNGNKAKDEDARKLTVVNGSDGTWSLWSEGKEVTKGTSTFDPTTTPKTLDFTTTEGDDAGKLYFGIYELGENSRKMCFAQLGKGRPSSFESTEGSGVICLTFERVKSP